MLTPHDFAVIVSEELTAENWRKVVKAAVDQAAAGDKDARNWLCNWSNVTGHSHECHSDDCECDECCDVCSDCAGEKPSDEDYLKHGFKNNN